MKKGKLVLTSLLSVLALSLTSCERAMERIDVECFEEMKAVLKDTFRKTFEHDNLTVVWSDTGGYADYTEEINGTTSHIVEKRHLEKKYGGPYETFSETWSFIDDNGEMISAKRTYYKDGTTEKEEKTSYMHGKEAYESTFKSFRHYFDMAMNIDTYLRPNSSEGGETDYFELTRFSGYKYTNVKYEDEDYKDYFNFDGCTYTGTYNRDLSLMVFGFADSETGLLTESHILLSFPSEAYSPFDVESKFFAYNFRYDTNKLPIYCPDVSTWEDITSK